MRKELFDSSKEVVLRRQAEEMADIISKASVRLDKDRSSIDYTSILSETDRLRRPMFLSDDGTVEDICDESMWEFLKKVDTYRDMPTLTNTVAMSMAFRSWLVGE